MSMARFARTSRLALATLVVSIGIMALTCLGIGAVGVQSAYAAGTNYANAEEVPLGEWKTDSLTVKKDAVVLEADYFKFVTPAEDATYTFSFQALECSSDESGGICYYYGDLYDESGKLVSRPASLNWNDADYSSSEEITLSGNSTYYFVFHHYFEAAYKDASITYRFKLQENPNEMYRLYNKNTGEHFYTASTDERDTLKRAGWTYEGVGWYAPKTSSTPVYRLYNSHVKGGDHHYTTSWDEASSLQNAGWTYEGIGWYSDDAKGTPLYRQYNPYAATGTHNYTTSKAENDSLVSAGWRAEGISWYGVA